MLWSLRRQGEGECKRICWFFLSIILPYSPYTSTLYTYSSRNESEKCFFHVVSIMMEIIISVFLQFLCQQLKQYNHNIYELFLFLPPQVHSSATLLILSCSKFMVSMQQFHPFLLTSHTPTPHLKCVWLWLYVFSYNKNIKELSILYLMRLDTLLNSSVWSSFKWKRRTFVLR